MSEQIREPKPLYLSAEEAMGLLDLCLLSRSEFDAGQESVVLKLSELVRRHLAAEAEEADAAEPPYGTETEGVSVVSEAPAEPRPIAEETAPGMPTTERTAGASRPPCPGIAPRTVFPIRYWMAG